MDATDPTWFDRLWEIARGVLSMLTVALALVYRNFEKRITDLELTDGEASKENLSKVVRLSVLENRVEALSKAVGDLNDDSRLGFHQVLQKLDTITPKVVRKR